MDDTTDDEDTIETELLLASLTVDDVLLAEDGALDSFEPDDGFDADPDEGREGNDGVENNVAEIGAVNGTPVCGSGTCGITCQRRLMSISC